jgi:hypothetical protein
MAEGHALMSDRARQNYAGEMSGVALFTTRLDDLAHAIETEHRAALAGFRATIDHCTRNSRRSRSTSDAVRGTPAWRATEDLLASVPGIGKTSARTLIAEMPKLGTLDRRKIAALVGVAPINRDSERLKKRNGAGFQGIRLNPVPGCEAASDGECDDDDDAELMIRKARAHKDCKTPCGLSTADRHHRHSSPNGHHRCGHCGEPVEPGVAGTTATSSGVYLHNACVDDWAACFSSKSGASA